MYYGQCHHNPSPEDLQINKCRCGWHTGEVTKVEVAARGLPVYCDNCGGRANHYVIFHPRERLEAYDALMIELPP